MSWTTKLARLNDFIAKIFPAIGIIAIIFFLSVSAQTQRQNKDLLEAINHTTETLERITQSQHDEQSAIQNTQLNKLNEALSQLDCLLALHVEGSATPEEIENCQTPTSSPPPNSQSSQNKQPGSPSPSEPNGGGEPPEPPEEPSLLEMLIAPITNLLRL